MTHLILISDDIITIDGKSYTGKELRAIVLAFELSE